MPRPPSRGSGGQPLGPPQASFSQTLSTGSDGGMTQQQQQRMTPTDFSTTAPTPVPPYMYNAGASLPASRPTASRVVPGQSLLGGPSIAAAPIPPSATTPMHPIPTATAPIHVLPQMNLLHNPSSWNTTQQPQQSPYPFPSMAPFPAQQPLLGSNHSTLSGLAPPPTSRQPVAKKRGRGKQRRRSSSPTGKSADGAPKRKRGRPPLSSKKRTSTTFSTAVPKPTVTIRDEFPNRIVNPLLDLPEFPTYPNPPPDYIPNGAELFKWSELYQTRPDTFPLSFYARLLGFDVPHQAPSNYVELDPITVPLIQDKIWTKVPNEGWFAGFWNKLSQKQLLDYMDPVYREIGDKYHPSHVTPSSTGAPLKHGSKEACIKFAREQEIMDKDWTFSFVATERDVADIKHLLGVGRLPLIKNPGEFVLLARHDGILKGLIHYRFNWYRIEEDKKDETVRTRSKVSELVFSIERVHCPDNTDWVRKQETSDKESPVAASAEPTDANEQVGETQEEPTGSTATEERKEGSTPSADFNENNEREKVEHKAKTVDKCETESMDENSSTVIAEKEAAAGEKSKLETAETAEVNKEKEPSLAKTTETAEANTEKEPSTDEEPVEHFLTDPAAVVLVALALEHARNCNIWYGISKIPKYSVAWYEDYFRMSPIIAGQQIASKDEKKTTESIPMVCDLQKCSYKYAFLLHRERKTSEMCGPNKSDASNETSHTRERLLVRFPNIDQASACLEQSGPQQPPSQVRGPPNVKKTPEKASRFCTGASAKMRGISFGIRASLPTPTSPPLELYALQEEGKKQGDRISTSAYKSDPSWEVLRVFAMDPIPTKKQISDENEEDSEILQELCKKQKQLISMEGGFEPKLRSLLKNVIDERREFEHSDVSKERESRKELLDDYQAVLERRREVDRAWQKQLEQDMDAVCDICADGEVTPDNQILFCEACNVAVHQMCYGVEKVPEGDYYCLACRYFDREKMTQAVARQLERGVTAPRMTASALPICCELCPRKQGAFYRSGTSSPTIGGKDEGQSNGAAAKWVHVVCAKWQGLGFARNEDKVVENVKDLKESFRNLQPRPRCMLCLGNRGAFNQCRHEGCSKWLHVSCARATGSCTVTHGENALGPVETNPWTLCCPEHSNIAPEDIPEGSVTVEQLVRAAREFPAEPDPPPPKPRPPRFNKMTGKERRKFLADPEYEQEFLTIMMHEKLQGVRCEVCDQCEPDGANLTRCCVCSVVFCDSCILPTDEVEKGQKYICLPCAFVEEQKESNEDFEIPLCHMCSQKGGWMREGFANPVGKKSYWAKNPKEFEKSLFRKKLWNHPLCTMWQNDLLMTDEEGRVNCANIIMSNGKGHILGKARCALCCQTEGVKVKCDEEGCRDPGQLRGPCYMHVTCARQAGFEVKDRVGDHGNYEFYAKCFRHSGNEFAFRAVLEDFIELERQRTGKKLSSVHQPMSLAHASRLLNAAIRAMHILGWAWRWAEWWVQYGNNWEPLLEPGEKEEDMTKEQLKIVDSTPESRCDDARRCRLTALGAALRNRDFDTEKGDDRVALDKALRAMLRTKSLVGPLETVEIDFFAEWLARAYRSKSRLLGFGDDKIPVRQGGSCFHTEDGSPKFELGSRPLPGKQDLPEGHVFESGITELDDFLKPLKLPDGSVVRVEDIDASAAPRKRNRSSAESPVSTKPGRKRKKASDQHEEEADDIPLKRSPGRPRKFRPAEALVSTPEQKPKKRGRKPRKSPQATSPTEPGTPATPKRRGRSPGRPRKTPPAPPEEDVEEAPLKRKRPGRKARTLTADLTAKASPAKRRPGRPRRKLRVIVEGEEVEPGTPASESGRPPEETATRQEAVAQVNMSLESELHVDEAQITEPESQKDISLEPVEEEWQKAVVNERQGEESVDAPKGQTEKVEAATEVPSTVDDAPQQIGLEAKSEKIAQEIRMAESVRASFGRIDSEAPKEAADSVMAEKRPCTQDITPQPVEAEEKESKTAEDAKVQEGKEASSPVDEDSKSASAEQDNKESGKVAGASQDSESLETFTGRRHSSRLRRNMQAEEKYEEEDLAPLSELKKRNSRRSRWRSRS